MIRKSENMQFNHLCLHMLQNQTVPSFLIYPLSLSELHYAIRVNSYQQVNI